MLSLCMIVKDEVVTLPACLASVRGVVDEIVILDTGSSDDTIAVAQDAGAQVHRFEWTNDFAAARNASLTHARGDWILVLDADERLLPVAIPAIRQLVAGQELAGVAAADVLLVNLVRHEAGAKQSPYTLVSRLFRRHPDLQFQRPYHETVDESVDRVRQREPHWQVVTLADVAIDHGGYRPDAVVARAKVERARSILEAMVAAHPADPYGCNKLGALYLQNGLQEKALPLLRQGLATGIADPVTCYELHYHLGLAYRQQNQLHQAIEHYQQALEQPVLPVLKVGTMLNLGSLLKAQGLLQQALILFQQAVGLAPDQAIAHYNLGLVYRAQGDVDFAIAAYQRAIALQPDYAEAYQNLGVALFKMGKLPDSCRAFQQALQLYQVQNPAEAIRLRQGIQQLGLVVGN